MMQSNELFTDRDREEIYAFFRTRDRWRDIVRWRMLEHGPVDTVFYGDSIFELWPTAEAFPELSHLNRGIGGDNINGLYFRLDEAIFPNSPRQVVINIGINGIERDFNDSIARLKFVAELMREHGIRVWCNSIAPLRAPDAWDRFQYQEKIVALNEVCRELFEREFAGFFDLHALLRDSSGQLAAEYAQPDGTHWTFAAYQAASKLLREKLLPEGKGKQ